MTAAPGPELSRPLRLDQIANGATGQVIADPPELLALARRFALRALTMLAADYRIEPDDGGWRAKGALRASLVQTCIATGDDVPAAIDTGFAIRFVAETGSDHPEDIELTEEDCDTMPVEGGAIDIGEAVAQTLALSIDPFPRSPGAEAALRNNGVMTEEEAAARAGPLAGLRDLLAGH